MDNIQLSDQQKELIERMGVFYEQHGIPPTESRIMSLLIVCDATELTFDQIRDMLSISKSATSTALNLLLLTEKVTYRTRPGDRKRYFASNILHWEESASDGFQKMLNVITLLKEALQQRTSQTPEFNGQLAKFIAFMEYLNSELPRLFEQWRAKQI